MAVVFENVYTPQDIFKYVILREDYTVKETLNFSNQLFSRIGENIFEGIWRGFYVVLDYATKYKIPLGYDQLQQIVGLNMETLLKMGVDKELNVLNDKLSEIERRDMVLDAFLNTLEELETSDVEDYENNLMENNMELFVQSWALEAYEKMLNLESVILRGEATVGKKTYVGAKGASAYHALTSTFIESLVERDAGLLSESIDTSEDTLEDIERKSAENDFGNDVANTGIELFDENVASFKKGEIVTIQAGSGVGKAIDIETILPSPTGKIKAKDVKKGTYLFDRKGNQTKVLEVYPQGITNRYKVILDDDREQILNSEHLVPYIENNKVVETELSKILEDYTEKDYYIPHNELVEYEGAFHEYDSYKIGYIIGKETYLEDSLYKNIPEVCLVDKSTGRKNLIKGLLDSTGGVNISDDEFNYKIVVKSKAIAKDIKTVCDSLGYMSYIKQEHGKQHILFYTMEMLIESETIQEELASKQFKEKQFANKIVTIEKIEDGETVCFLVDNMEHLFLINDYIVTHNTRFSSAISYNGMLNYKSNVLFISLEQKSTAIYPMFEARHVATTDDMIENMTDKDIREKTYPLHSATLLEDRKIDLVENQDIGRLRIEGKSLGAKELKNYLITTWDKGFHFDIVVLDYIGLIEVENKRYDDVTAVINMLKSECKTFKGKGFLCIIPNQIKPEIEAELRKGNTDLSKLGGAESQAIVRASDYVLTLAQTEEEEKNNLMTLITSKIRLGNPISKINLIVDKGKLLFNSIDEDDLEEF